MARALARGRLGDTQSKMKSSFDRTAEYREFLPGDQVLALLPLVGSPGPHSVVKKLSELDYLISAPDRKLKNQWCCLFLFLFLMPIKGAKTSFVSPLICYVPEQILTGGARGGQNTLKGGN